MENIFRPADMLLPENSDYSIWSVIACDQFSSEKEYWDRVSEKAENKESTLHMIIPEAYLEGIDQQAEAEKRNDVMREYLEKGVFKTYESSYIYIEREITGGIIRRGLVGMIDLDEYEYTPGVSAHIKASERTVEERLPARIKVRKNAPIELPHVMVFIDDKKRQIVENITEVKDSLEKIYDFDLMENGGHLTGWRVAGEDAKRVTEAFKSISENPVQIVIGDGNHSLAAAKKSWDAIKETLPEGERDDHPAKFALVELNNIYDEGIVFEPIHRVAFGVEPKALINAFKEAYGNEGLKIKCLFGNEEDEVIVPDPSFGAMVGNLQSLLEKFVSENGGEIDYIHDYEAAKSLSEKDGTIAFLLPTMDKEELFKTVEQGIVFPKKSFSVGHARDKRYYLECRKIK